MKHKISIRDINGLANILAGGNEEQKRQAKMMHDNVLRAIKNKIDCIYLDDEIAEEKRVIEITKKLPMLLSINQKEEKDKMKIRIKFKWHDRWIGSYDEIRRKKKFVSKYDVMPTVERYHHYWICIIPCFPIHIWWEMKNVRCSKMSCSDYYKW